ncbi:MAG: pyridoxal kinase PdxY [Pseudomonadota bacterium]
MNILSIQSSVAYGHVGNSAAVFPLQRLGYSVWPVITVHFSNHLGYGAARGPVLPAEDVADVIRGIEEREVMADCDAVLSGYMGDASIGTVILDAVDTVRRHRPDAVYCCDPVMGDVGTGFYVRPGIPEFMRDRAVPAATLVTPNQFELEYLTGLVPTDLASVLAAVDKVRAMGPAVVLVTSLRRHDGPADRIEMLAVSGEGAWLLSNPLLPVDVNGAGDATAALFLAHWLSERSVADALSKTAETIYSVLERTLSAGTREIQLIAAQDAIADPPRRFDVEKVR